MKRDLITAEVKNGSRRMSGPVLLLCLALCAFTGTSRAADWPMFRGNAARTGYIPEQAAPPLTEKWAFQASGAILSSPVVYDGRVYFGTKGGYIYALDARTGAELWSFHTLNWVDASPAVSSGAVYAASLDGHLYALDRLTGRQVWRAYLGAPSDSSPLVTGGKVYVGTGLPDDKLRVFDALTGDPLGSFQAGQPVESAPAAYGANIYFGANDGTVYALDAASLLAPAGWLDRPSAGSFRLNAVAVSNGVIYSLPGHDEKRLFGLDAATGAQLSTAAAGEQSVSWQTFTSPAVGGGRVYFAGAIGQTTFANAGDEYLSALDTGTLASVWASSPVLSGISNMGILSSPALAGELVYAGTVDGRLVAVSSEGVQAASLVLSSAAYSSPAVSNGYVYIGDMAGKLHAFSAGRTAAISAPAPEEVLNGSVTVSGCAANPAMSGYTLDYSTGGSPEVWHNIVSSNTSAHTEGGALASWDTSALGNGYYTLKLTVLETGLPAYANTALARVRVNSAPLPPPGLTAADVPGDTGNKIRLAWTASPSAGITGYRVYRDDGEGDGFVLLASTQPSPPAYTDAAAVTGSTYTYAVRAYDGYLESADSAHVSAFSINDSGDNTPPAAVTDLSAVPGPAPGIVLLGWTAPGNDGNIGTASRYVIKYTTSPSYDWSGFNSGAGLAVSTREVDGPAGIQEAEEVHWLLGGVTYYFALKTEDLVPNYSGVSNVASAYAARDPLAPLPPSGLSAIDTPDDAGGSVSLSWTLSPDDGAGAGNVYGYRVFRRLGDASYVSTAPYAEVSRGVSSYKDNAATKNVKYFYTVAAFNSTNNSVPTAEVSAVSADNYRFVDSSQGGYFLLPDGARVDIPGNSISQPDSIILARLDPVTYEPLARVKAAAGANPTGIVYEVKFKDPATRLLANAKLTLPYTDPEVAGMDVENLRLYTLSGGAWRMLTPSAVDAQARKVSAEASHFSLFTVMEYLPSGELFSGDEVYTYPNPAKGDLVTFKFRVAYKSYVKVDVYDIAGQQVASLEKADCPAGQTSEIAWNVRRIASGIYIYRVRAESASGNKAIIKKLAVIH